MSYAMFCVDECAAVELQYIIPTFNNLFLALFVKEILECKTNRINHCSRWLKYTARGVCDSFFQEFLDLFCSNCSFSIIVSN